MKYLKFLLGILLLLFLFVIIRGQLTPSITYDTTVVVDKPINEAWEVMQDESKVSQWLLGLSQMEHISGEKGKVGAVTKYTFIQDGVESEIVETMTEVVPNKRVAMTFVMEDVMEMDYKMELSSVNNKTEIKSTTINKGLGFMMKSIFPFMKGTMQATEDENMNRLKKVINENTTNYFKEAVVN